ncbi:MAG: tyrosine-protein phosphatase [Saccharofermentanales bacterium]
MIDFHSHILPAVDDGAKSMDDSFALLSELRAQQFTDIVCTPHFYPSQTSIDSFIAKRDHVFTQLCEHALVQSQKQTCEETLEQARVKVNFYPGAEVYLNEFLLICNDLAPLCIKGTNILLLEMPFSARWPSDYRKIIRKLVERHSITPMIAHAERYPVIMKHGSGVLGELIDSGCVIQANCDSFLDPHIRSKVLKWLDCGMIQVIATDCHDMASRPPHMKQAREVISRELGPDALLNLDHYAARLLKSGVGRNNLFF